MTMETRLGTPRHRPRHQHPTPARSRPTGLTPTLLLSRFGMVTEVTGSEAFGGTRRREDSSASGHRACPDRIGPDSVTGMPKCRRDPSDGPRTMVSGNLPDPVTGPYFATDDYSATVVGAPRSGRRPSLGAPWPRPAREIASPCARAGGDSLRGVRPQTAREGPLPGGPRRPWRNGYK